MKRLHDCSGRALSESLEPSEHLLSPMQGTSVPSHLLLQSETYRRMKKANRGDWHSFTPVTNTLWMHYLADILLNRKQRNFDAGEKRELRNFR